MVDVLDACPPRHQCITDDGPCPLAPECAGKAKSRKPSGTSPTQVPGHITIDDAIALKTRVGSATWNAEMLCLRPQRSGCVLPEFDEPVHTVDNLPPGADAWTWIAGMDFGIRSPTVVLFAALDPSGVLWVADEYIQTDTALDAHVETIRAFAPAPQWIGVDPAGGQRANQTGISDVQAMRNRGLRVRDRRLRLHEGLNLVRARLKPAAGGPRLYIRRSCQRLIESMAKYHYPRDRPFADTPEKDGHDHCVDALRYMIQNLDMKFTAECENYMHHNRGG